MATPPSSAEAKIEQPEKTNRTEKKKKKKRNDPIQFSLEYLHPLTLCEDANAPTASPMYSALHRGLPEPALGEGFGGFDGALAFLFGSS